MKKIITTTLIVVSAIVLMSFATIVINTEKEIETATIETVQKKSTLNSETPNNDCYWEETFGSNISGVTGQSCGSSTSMKIYFTNPYSYTVRVAFYLGDEYGNYNQYGPHVVSVRPGREVYHHICKSTGHYVVLAARAGDYCTFPTL